VTDETLVRSLLDYMRSATAHQGLAYAEKPTHMSGGFDATILGFSLRGAPKPFSGPLVLRLLQANADRRRVTREAAMQNALAELGYPAPRVFVAEERTEQLGGAFLIMERMPGRPLGWEFEALRITGIGQVLNVLPRLPHIRRELLRLWEEAQTSLHSVSVADFLARVERAGFSGHDFSFDFCFTSLRAAAAELDLKELRPAIDWLVVHEPRRSQAAVICHGDFQPFNVLADNGRLTGVIDWVKVTIADPAFDYGAVIAILATVPIRAHAGLHQLLRAVMNGLARTHSGPCRSLPESNATLCYYQIFNCVLQLITVARNRAQGRMTHGVYNSPIGVANLINHVHRLIGLKVNL
jgi:aminoglycoside phosphotransferase (APT) family kinase protein